MTIFRAVVKGDMDAVKLEVETRGIDFYNAELHPSCIQGFVHGEGVDANYMNEWFLSGPASPPYGSGVLLHWSPVPSLRGEPERKGYPPGSEPSPESSTYDLAQPGDSDYMKKL